MAIKCYKQLTWAVYNNFIGRKGNAFSFFVDTNADCFYMVPTDFEHIDFASMLLGVDKADISQDPSLASHLVPVVVEVTPMHDQITGAVVGVSGIEIAFGVRHSNVQMATAKQLALKFLENSEVPLSPTFELKVVMRYVA